MWKCSRDLFPQDFPRVSCCSSYDWFAWASKEKSSRPSFILRFMEISYQPLTCFSIPATEISNGSLDTLRLWSRPFPQSGTPLENFAPLESLLVKTHLLSSGLYDSLWLVRISPYSCSFMCVLFLPWNKQTNQSPLPKKKAAKIVFFTLSPSHFLTRAKSGFYHCLENRVEVGKHCPQKTTQETHRYLEGKRNSWFLGCWWPGKREPQELRILLYAISP